MSQVKYIHEVLHNPDFLFIHKTTDFLKIKVQLKTPGSLSHSNVRFSTEACNLPGLVNLVTDMEAFLKEADKILTFTLFAGRRNFRVMKLF